MSDYVFAHCEYCDGPIREPVVAQARDGRWVHEWCKEAYEAGLIVWKDDKYREHRLHRTPKLG